MGVHNIVGGKFVCTAEPDAGCLNYPACDCEYWSPDVHGPVEAPKPGHEPVPQAECWLQGWLDAGDLWESYEDGEATVRSNDEFPDGEIETEWQGDFVTWSYVDEPEWPVVTE